DPPVVKWLDNNRFDVLRFHLRDHFGQMRGRRRDSRLWFEKEIDVEAETVREVRPRIMICCHVLAVKRQQRCTPFLQLGVDGRFELLVVSFVKCGIYRIESGKRLRNMLSNRLRNDRIDSEMWITERMHITGGARDVRGYIHEPNPLRCLDASRLTDLDLRVPRIL